MTATKREAEKAERTGSSFQPASSGWLRACQLFPGFSALPTPVLVSLEPYAALVDPAGGVLHAADREAIAAAVVEVVVGRRAADATRGAADSRRGVALADFASRLVAGASYIDRVDLDRLVRSGFSADEVHAAAETAIGFHVVASLAHAAGGRRPLARLRSPGDPAAAMFHASGGEPVRAA